MKNYIKYFILILAGILVIVGANYQTRAITMTPEELLSLQMNGDIAGAVNVDNIITHGQLEAQGTASSTFNNTIRPSTNNTYDLGGQGYAWRNLFLGGTLNVSSTSFSGNLLPDVNNLRDISTFGTAWRDIYASGTIYATELTASGGAPFGTNSASSTIKGGASSTSTISSSVTIQEASATSTLYIGSTGVSGQGGCIVLASGDGSGNLYLYAAGGTLQLTTSTNARACF